MGKKSKTDATSPAYRPEHSGRDVFDEMIYDEILYDESSCEEYPDLQYAAVSEGADAKDLFNAISRELPPRHLGKREKLTEAQKLSKLGAASAKKKKENRS